MSCNRCNQNINKEECDDGLCPFVVDATCVETTKCDGSTKETLQEYLDARCSDAEGNVFVYNLILDGSANNGLAGDYVDLVTPAPGKVVDFVQFVALPPNLSPDTVAPSFKLVLKHATSPDINLSVSVTAEDMNDYMNYKLDAVPTIITTGYSLKILVSGANLTGNLKVIIHYIPS